MDINHNLMVLEAHKLDFASMLGLAELTRMVLGTPCEATLTYFEGYAKLH